MPRNRPLSRSIIKLGARLLAGRSRAHVQDWFPGLKLVRPTQGKNGAIRYRGIDVGKLIRSGDVTPTGKTTIFIVGSGPSIARSDLTRVPARSCILLNGALALVPVSIAAPLAVAIEDERFVWRHFDLLQRIPTDCPCLFSVSVLRAICEIDAGWLKERVIALIDDIRKPYAGSRRNDADLKAMTCATMTPDGKTGFSSDPDQGVFQGGSVVISAAQFAISWAPRSIGFVGIDISNADQPRFYETQDKAYSGLLEGQARILDHLMLARNVAEEKGIRVVNHSPVSALSGRGFMYDDALVVTPAG